MSVYDPILTNRRYFKDAEIWRYIGKVKTVEQAITSFENPQLLIFTIPTLCTSFVHYFPDPEIRNKLTFQLNHVRIGNYTGFKLDPDIEHAYNNFDKFINMFVSDDLDEQFVIWKLSI